MLHVGRTHPSEGGRIKKVVTEAGLPEEDATDVLFMDTLLRYYLHLDPTVLSDEEWAMTIVHLREIRRLENNGIK